MRGATSPRLLLELTCAQVLLPAAATDEKSLLARLERLESAERGTPAPLPAAPQRPQHSAPADRTERPRGTTASPPDDAAPGQSARSPSAPVSADRVSAVPAAEGLAAADSLAKNWHAVVEAVRQESRVAWALLRNASVLSLEDGVLTLRFPSVGEMKGFSVSGHDAVLKRVLSADFGLNVTVRGVTGTDSGAGPARTAGPADPGQGHAPAGPGAVSRPAAPAVPAPAAPAVSAVPDEIPPDEPDDGGQAPGETELTGMDLIQRELGGRVIGEIEG
jgi:DNA polymerase III subunit gamma/tau